MKINKTTFLNTKKLSEAIRAKRGNRGMGTVAKEIGGISKTTLSRIEQGRLSDINNFIRVCEWLEVSTDLFTGPSDEVSSSQKYIASCLREDKSLPAETAEALIQIIKLAYDKGGKKQKKR